jgi:hypothetical protein
MSKERTEAQKAQVKAFNAAGVRKARAAQAERVARGKPRARERGADGVVELSRSEQLERGIISVHDLSDEELAMKRCYSANREFNARPYPHSPKILAAMDIELLSRGNNIIRKGFVKATEALVVLLDHPEARVRVMAIDRITERVAGKVPDQLISADVTPHSQVGEEIAEAVAKALGYHAEAITSDLSDIVDGEIVEDEGPASQAPVRKTRKRG